MRKPNLNTHTTQHPPPPPPLSLLEKKEEKKQKTKNTQVKRLQAVHHRQLSTSCRTREARVKHRDLFTTQLAVTQDVYADVSSVNKAHHGWTAVEQGEEEMQPVSVSCVRVPFRQWNVALESHHRKTRQPRSSVLQEPSGQTMRFPRLMESYT